MNEVYCRVCDNFNDDAIEEITEEAAATAVLSAVNEDADSPACLATVPASNQINNSRKKKSTNLLNVESELELPGSGTKINVCSVIQSSIETSKVTPSPKRDAQNNNGSRRVSIEELEFGDDVSAALDDDIDGQTMPILPSGNSDATAVHPICHTRVQGSEELPVQQSDTIVSMSIHALGQRIEDVVLEKENTEVRLNRGSLGLPIPAKAIKSFQKDDRNGNDHQTNRVSSTLPKSKSNKEANKEEMSTDVPRMTSNLSKIVTVAHPKGNGLRCKVPMRTTPDGTNIYYWCDMSRRTIKGGTSNYLLFF